MTFKPQHTGLYFTQQHIDDARAHRSDAPLAAAWSALQQHDSDDVFEKALIQAYRYHFDENQTAGDEAATYARTITIQAVPDPNVDTLMQTVAAIHLFEMVRNIAAFGDTRAWLRHLTEALQTDTFNQLGERTTPLLRRLWYGTLCIVGGVANDDEQRFDIGRQIVQQAIDEAIHPEGYLKAIVEDQTLQSQPDGTVRGQLLGVCALVLAAEAATHAGVDLWAYENRHVGIKTAAAYSVYYFHFPDKWRWQTPLSEAETHDLYRRYGAIFEMVERRATLHGLPQLLDDLRPMQSVLTGGLTTLSHALAQPDNKRKRQGLFGRR